MTEGSCVYFRRFFFIKHLLMDHYSTLKKVSVKTLPPSIYLCRILYKSLIRFHHSCARLFIGLFP